MDEEFNFLNEADVERAELLDQAETVGFLTPGEYAKLRNMRPQLVHYYIRVGVLEKERCQCGRWVIHVDTSDKALQARQKARGGDLDTRHDADRVSRPRLVVQDLPQENQVERP
jgi:hypothetical protein